jgi:flavodoxin
MSIWNSAQTGTLTKEKLEEFLQKDPNLTIDSEDKSGFTPLGYALRGGNTKVVELLLKNGANVDKKIGETIKPQDLRTPLYLAATALKNAARCVQLVLEKTPQTLDEPVPGSWKDQTPLMAAVAQPNPNPQVIKLLREQGASTEKKNSDGKSAVEIAQALHPQRQDVKDALNVVPSKKRGGLSNYIQGWVFSVLKYFNIWTPLDKIFGAASKYFYKVTSPSGVDPGLVWCLHVALLCITLTSVIVQR